MQCCIGRFEKRVFVKTYSIFGVQVPGGEEGGVVYTENLPGLSADFRISIRVSLYQEGHTHRGGRV